MKTIVRILMTALAVMIFANFASAQIGQYLCEGTAVKGYEAEDGDVLSNYEWTVSPGASFVGGINNTKQVQIDWTAVAPGDYTLTVKEGPLACQGVEHTLVVRVSPQPTVAISFPAGGFVCNGAAFDLEVDYDGTASTWAFSYTVDGGVPIAVSGLTVAGQDPYTLNIAGIAANTDFEIVEISDNACSTPAAVSETVTVEIQTYNTSGITPL